MPPTLAQVVAAKRAVKAAVARRAARKYTWVWDEIIKEAQGIDPKKTEMPPGFKGTQNQKFQRALLYKNRIINWAHGHKKSINKTLYRGIKRHTWEYQEIIERGIVHKTTLSSFTTDYKIARGFARNEGIILELRTTVKLPAIDFANKNFQSEYAPGGKKYYVGGDEKEVLLPPGTFKVSGKPRRKVKDKYSPLIYRARYTPDKIDTSYLHREPQIRVPSPVVLKKGVQWKSNVASPPKGKVFKQQTNYGLNHKGRKIHVGPKGGTFLKSASGKIIYKTLLPPVSQNSFGKNSKGRQIYKGPKGGFYVLQNGKKTYKFIY